MFMYHHGAMRPGWIDKVCHSMNKVTNHIISNCCLPDFFDKTLEGDAGEEAKDLLVSTVT